jgi:hypothetical protein
LKGKSFGNRESIGKCLGNQYIMNKKTTTTVFKKLLKEVLAICDPSLPDGFESNKIKAPSLRLVIKEIKRITAIHSPAADKTIRKYYHAIEYDPSFTFIGFLAAIWLIHKEKLTKEECTEFYKHEPYTSNNYWIEFLKATSEDEKIEEPGLVSDEDIKNSLIPEISDLQSMFKVPDFAKLLHRLKPLDDLFNMSSKHRVIVIDGIAGSGKKHIVAALQEKLLNSGRYKSIFWRRLEKGYKLIDLVNELDDKIKLNATSENARIAQFLEWLKSNQVVFILYNIEDADDASFLELFETITMGGNENAVFILLRNNQGVFKSIPIKCQMQLSTYSLDEVVAFAELSDIRIDEDQAQKIREISVGLPFYIDLLLQICQIFKSDPGYQKKKDSYIAQLEYKLDSWCRFLSIEDKDLLQILSLFKRDFSTSDYITLGERLQLTDTEASFKRISDAHLVSHDNNDVWHIIRPVAEFYSNKYNIKEHRRLHEIIANYLLLTITPTDLFNFSNAQLVEQTRCLLHFQKAQKFEKSTPFLIFLIPLLKRNNFYPLLYTLLQTEIQNNPSADHWIRWHLSHCCLILGKRNECLENISICLNLSHQWHKKKFDLPSSRTFYIKSQVLFAELVSATVSNETAANIVIETLSSVDPSDLEWHIRSQSLSALSGFYEKLGDFVKSDKINETIHTEDKAGSRHTLAISFTHRGIDQYNLTNFTFAEELLNKAEELFRDVNDRRGWAWCSSHLILCQLQLDEKVFSTTINEIINIRQEGQNFDSEYQVWLKTLVEKISDSKMLPKLNRELELVTEKIVEIDKTTPFDQIKKLVEANNKFFLGNVLSTFEFESQINPIDNNSLPISSQLIKSIRKEIRINPQKYLSDIEAKDPMKVFTSEFDNKVIIECIGLYGHSDRILKKIILPNLSLIASLDDKFDKTKISYAIALHNVGEHDSALTLLDSVSAKNHRFFYLNTKANCYWEKGKRGNNDALIEKSDTYYEYAGQAAKTNKEKAIHYHNMAVRTYKSKYTDLYEDAKQKCLESIKLTSDDARFIRFPINTLILLDIEMASEDDVIFVVNRLKNQYDITLGWLSNIIRNVRSVIKKNKLQQEFHDQHPDL